MRIKVEDHACCYYQCHEEGTVHIGPHDGDSHWICFRLRQRWNQNRARLLADGGGVQILDLLSVEDVSSDAVSEPLIDNDMRSLTFAIHL
jgi:hypothetical protein